MPHVIEHKIRVLGRSASPLRSSLPSSENHTEFGRYAELQKDKSLVEFPFERTHGKEKQQQKKKMSTFSGGEETFGMESFERNLRYSPHEVDRQHFGVRTFDEKIPMRDENDGKSERNGGVRFEDKSEPIQQNAFDQNEGKNRFLHRSRHLDTTPIRIPRARIGPLVEKEHGANEGEWRHHSQSIPNSCHSSSVGWPSSPSPSPQCLSVNSNTQPQNMPMKKVIRRSRMVSIHDGRPMGPFTEKVHYEPTTIGHYSSADEGRGRSLSSGRRRRTTTSNGQWGNKLNGSTAATALWTSSSASSLSSNDERETNARAKNNQGRRGEGRRKGKGRGGERRGGKQHLVHVQHNPLFYGAAERHF